MFHLMAPWRERRTEAETANPLSLFRDEVFDRFFEGWLTPMVGTWRPAWSWDVEETDKEVVLRAEMPGFEVSEIDVRVAGDVLTIRAEHQEEAKGKEKNGLANRRMVERTMTLPVGTNPELLTATYRNGLLEVHVPKVPEATPRRINVTT